MGEKITVQTYAGYKADERPVSFCFAGRTLRIKEIVDRWIEVDHSYFTVVADDGRSYLLRNDRSADTWELVKGPGKPGR